MKSKLLKRILFLLLAMAVFYAGLRYGHTHRTFREKMEYIWDSGRGFERGWAACENAYGIKWISTNGWYGWVCTRVAGNVPPGWHEEVTATNRYEP